MHKNTKKHPPATQHSGCGWERRDKEMERNGFRPDEEVMHNGKWKLDR
jgi:hypothetical protein